LQLLDKTDMDIYHYLVPYSNLNSDDRILSLFFKKRSYIHLIITFGKI